ncbi:MAG: hypothetical protein CMF24_04085 [Ilumatobacter sp.]|nr:hypothetical protein [Ilumatobacter sp.]
MDVGAGQGGDPTADGGGPLRPAALIGLPQVVVSSVAMTLTSLGGSSAWGTIGSALRSVWSSVVTVVNL